MVPELTTRIVVVEIKYNVIHRVNCRLDPPLYCSTTQMEKKMRRTCSIEESSRTSVFADFAI